jgi:LmbE family N-acetylglucosaminyl deacetylase
MAMILSCAAVLHHAFDRGVPKLEVWSTLGSRM